MSNWEWVLVVAIQWAFCLWLGWWARGVGLGRRIVEMGGSYGGHGGLRRRARTTTQPNAPDELAWVGEEFKDDGFEPEVSDAWFRQDGDGTIRAGYTSHDEEGRHVDAEFIGSPASAWEHFRPWDSLANLERYAAFRYGPDWDKRSGPHGDSNRGLERG